MLLFPVLLPLLTSQGDEPDNLRRILVAALAFISRAALLPSNEYDCVDKAMLTRLLKQWRLAYCRCLGAAYFNLNEVRHLRHKTNRKITKHSS